MPDAGQPSSGYLVQVDDVVILIDCGPGTLGELRRYVEPRDLDAVVLSHLHIDHCYDVIPLGKTLLGPGIDVTALADAKRTLLIAPRGTIHKLRAINALLPVGPTASPLDRVVDDAFCAIEVDPGDSVHLNNVVLSFARTAHQVDCNAVRIESSGRSFAYSGDTGWSDSLVEFVRGVDLLLCEATLRTPDVTGHGHLAASEAGRLAELAGVSELILTHFTSTDLDHLEALRRDAAHEFDGVIHMARPSLSVTTR